MQAIAAVLIATTKAVAISRDGPSFGQSGFELWQITSTGYSIGEEVAKMALLTQNPVRTNLEKLSGRRGQFDGYNIYGFQLRGPDGTVSWKISMWNGDGHADYWVTGSEFREVGTHLLDPSANGGTTYAIGPITEAPETERKAVQAALKFWRENAQAPNSDFES